MMSPVDTAPYIHTYQHPTAKLLTEAKLLLFNQETLGLPGFPDRNERDRLSK